MEWLLLVVVVLVVGVGLWLVLTYNGLVRKRNRVDNAWGQIDVQLKRRRDLVPNLVQTVQGYASHERATFEAVTQARATAEAATSPAALGQAEGIRSCRPTRGSVTCRLSSPRPRTASPCPARSTTTPC
jgi:LemA protein